MLGVSRVYLALAALPAILAQYTHISDERVANCTRGDLCLTTFDWCSTITVAVNGTNGNNDTTTRPTVCDLRELADDANFLNGSPFTWGSAWAGIFSYSSYNLSWINADGAYPVRIQWFTGPEESVINQTVPLWETNVTDTSIFNFRVIDLVREAGQQVDSSIRPLIWGYVLGWPSFFIVSQPDRPIPDGINTSDRSTGVMVFDGVVDRNIQAIRRTNDADNAEERRKWRLGVGIGVGLGVPLLMLIAYAFGRSGGKKKAMKSQSMNQKTVSPDDGATSSS